MAAAAIQLGVFLYAILSMFVTSAMSMNVRQNRSSSGMMVMTGWGLFAFSATTAVTLMLTAAAMACGLLPEDAISIAF